MQRLVVDKVITPDIVFPRGLVEDQLISTEDLETALSRQRESGESLVRTLIGHRSAPLAAPPSGYRQRFLPPEAFYAFVVVSLPESSRDELRHPGSPVPLVALGEQTKLLPD